MTEPLNISAVIDLWPTRKDLASDLDVSVDRVHKWAQTNAVPARFHFGLLNAAVQRGYPVTADLLVRLHAGQPEAA